VLRKVADEGRCRTCSATEGLTKHHLVSQSWFRATRRVGRHAPANVVPLCLYCHRLIDATNNPWLRLEKRRALRATLTKKEIRFIVKTRGPDWLDHQYPVSTVVHGR
jgi:hypothetical protein